MDEELIPETENQEITEAFCPSCKEPVGPGDAFCQSCGYPLKGSEDEQRSFSTDRLIKEDKLEEMEKKVRSASNTMYILAGLFVLFGIVYFGMADESDNRGVVLLINFIVAGIYVGLGYWSRLQPLPAILAGLILYTVVTILNAMSDPNMIWRGILVKILVFVFLIKGLTSAYQAQRIKKELNIG